MTIREFIQYIEAHAKTLPDGLDTPLRYVDTENSYGRTTVEVDKIFKDPMPFCFVPRADVDKSEWSEHPAAELIIAEFE